MHNVSAVQKPGSVQDWVSAHAKLAANASLWSPRLVVYRYTAAVVLAGWRYL